MIHRVVPGPQEPGSFAPIYPADFDLKQYRIEREDTNTPLSSLVFIPATPLGCLGDYLRVTRWHWAPLRWHADSRAGGRFVQLLRHYVVADRHADCGSLHKVRGRGESEDLGQVYPRHQLAQPDQHSRLRGLPGRCCERLDQGPGNPTPAVQRFS